jgi:hypothetical protein
VLHDAVPNPQDRVGHPMHIKVRTKESSVCDNKRFFELAKPDSSTVVKCLYKL